MCETRTPRFYSKICKVRATKELERKNSFTKRYLDKLRLSFSNWQRVEILSIRELRSLSLSLLSLEKHFLTIHFSEVKYLLKLSLRDFNKGKFFKYSVICLTPVPVSRFWLEGLEEISRSIINQAKFSVRVFNNVSWPIRWINDPTPLSEIFPLWIPLL